MEETEIQRLCADLHDWNRHKEAIRLLAEIGTPAIPALCALLAEPQWRIRDRAVQTLVLMRLAAVPALCRLALEGNIYARSEAVHALALIRDPRAIADLSRVLNDAEIQVRVKAIEALEQIGSIAAVAALDTALDTQPIRLQRHMIEALGRIGRPCAVPALCRMAHGGSASLRRHAVAALQKLDKKKPLLRQILAERSMTEQARVEAIRALALVCDDSRGGERCYPLLDLQNLCRLAARDADPAVKIGALETLHWMNNRGTLLRASTRSGELDRRHLVRPAPLTDTDAADLLRPCTPDQPLNEGSKTC